MRSQGTLKLHLLLSIVDSSLDNFKDVLHWSLGWPHLNYTAVVVQQIFVEIPLWDNTRVICQVFPHRADIRPQDLHLLEDSEADSVLLEGHIPNLCRFSGFLVS